ncbi:MAG: DUF4198 domain-containing protein [Planctomycetaceae bacterium]|jgi:hypothetical protein|nr:DUF4198 domain-containing protein [Planctomycetaceae bacterium]
MLRFYLILCTGVILLTCFSGCKPSLPYEIVPFSGTVTYQGKPAPNTEIIFAPEIGRPSNGRTDANGRFTMIYTVQYNGVQKGKGKFFFQTSRMIGDNSIVSELQKVLEKYGAENTPLQFDIQKAEKNFEIKLE